MSERVTVLGAGVIGLTIALRLAESGYLVTIVARDLPGDSNSQAFASPWAGAVWHSFSTLQDEQQVRWETLTFKKIWSLISLGVVMKLDALDYHNEQPEPYWFKDMVSDYRVMDSSELPQGIPHGITYTTWSIHAPVYIQWLEARLRSLGVEFVRETVRSIEEPFLQSFGKEGNEPASVVVNATALGARTLIGVEDTLVYPIRGQTVVIWAPHYKYTVSGPSPADPNTTPPTYIIPRPGGECVLGGTFGINDWKLSTDAATTEGIVRRCFALAPTIAHDPSLGPESIPILKVNVGLRPARKGGARLEREQITVPLKRGGDAPPFRPRASNVTAEAKPRQVDVVHAYGNGPAGFQASWGMAEDALELVRGCFEDRRKANKE